MAWSSITGKILSYMSIRLVTRQPQDSLKSPQAQHLAYELCIFTYSLLFETLKCILTMSYMSNLYAKIYYQIIIQKKKKKSKLFGTC